MAELVYALVLGTSGATLGSSSLPPGTIAKQIWGRERRSDVEPAGETASRGRENAQATACALFVTESPSRHNEAKNLVFWLYIKPYIT